MRIHGTVATLKRLLSKFGPVSFREMVAASLPTMPDDAPLAPPEWKKLER
jgi:hypothetical protein